MTETMSLPETKTGAGGAPKARPNLVIFVLAFSGIVVALMQTLVLPIVAKLPEYLGAPASDTAWVVTATLLAAAVATPLMGRLGDMFGKRRMMIISLSLLIAGSLIAALSSTLVPMIAGRLLQGLAMGFIPLAISIMRDLLPNEKLPTATSVMSASLGIGAAIGLPAAAFVAESFDWHALFWTAAILGVVSLVLVLATVPESAQRAGGRFDFLGAIGLSIGLLCLMLAISKGGDWGWGAGLTIGLFIAAVVVFLFWGFYQLRTKEPMVDLRTTAKRQVLFTNLAGIAFGFASLAIQLIVPQIVQMPEATGYGIGGTLLQAGLVMTPQGIVIMCAAPLSARISRTLGPKAALMIGAVVVAVGYGLNIVMMNELWQLIIVSCIIGAGIGIAYGALPLLIMGAVPRSETGAANSLNALLRSIGSSLASALSGVILAQMVITVGDHALPSADGFRVIMAIGCAGALLALLLAAFLPKKSADVPEAAHGH
ncbi:MFS transporter [Brevibacterium zhoupengii]|uniref:MFS transporter n=1 Tax=Brevibacterium zhoupengii TaxID=2898795 RepID=UPI001E4E0A80|nr:MFS transporter [Brevibacterium zhoupengii]